MEMYTDDGIEDGNAFAIPDLYKPSNLAQFEDAAPEVEELQPLSTQRRTAGGSHRNTSN